MTPLEERLQQALNARAEQITHETVSLVRPPGPARKGPGRIAVTTAVLAAAATAAIVGTVAFSSLGRPTSSGPAATGGKTVAVATTTTPEVSTTPSSSPAPTMTTTSTSGTTETPSVSQENLTDGTTTVNMKPASQSAGSTASFRGTCPNPGERGVVASKAFLQDDDHDLNGIGAQSFTVKGDGTFAGSIAIEPDVTPDTYEVSLWCGSTDGKPDRQTEFTVEAAQLPGTDQDIRLAAHAFFPGEWVAFAGVCQGGVEPAGWVMSPAFEVSPGHEYAGEGAAPFQADKNGMFVGSAHIPDDAEAGVYKVSVRCNGGVFTKTESLDVLAR